MELTESQLRHRRIFSHSPEAFQTLYREAIDRAWTRFERGIAGQEMVEPDLETHFEKYWGRDDEYLHHFVQKWRGNKSIDEPRMLVSNETGDRTFLLDVSDVVISRAEDTHYYYWVGSCFILNVDLNLPDGTKTRAGYHLPGIIVDKELAIAEFIKLLETKGQIQELTIMYNTYGQGQVDTDALRDCTKSHQVKIIDLDQVDEWGSHDVFIKGNEVSVYHNEGEAGSDEQKIKRVFGGKIML